MEHIYRTKGTCSREISFELDGDKVRNVHFVGGCDGNLKAVSKLVDGMSVAQIEALLGSISGLDRTLEERVRALIDSMGLAEQFTSVEEFLALLNDVELIRSELLQTDSDLTLTFSRLAVAENNLTQIFSYFEFGDENGTPYLDMGSSSSNVKMRLTNTRLSFVQAGTELAYFSDNKLYVTRLEAVEQISIGTSSNGFLDIVTTPTGVGFKWRT